MTDLPAPPLPPDVDLRDFPFMPLDVQRLRDSDLAGTPKAEIFRLAVLSWCASWHQVPAGSLPDDDVSLARLLGFGRDGVKSWKKVRATGALHGWIKCSDGRLYHPVVVEKAIEAWGRRTTASARGKAGASKRWGASNASANAQAIQQPSIPDGTSNSASINQPLLKNSNGQGQDRDKTGQGQDRDTQSAREIPAQAGIGTNADEPPQADTLRASTDDPRETFDDWTFTEQRIKPIYPRGTFGDHVWLDASRNIGLIVERGLATAEQLVTLTHAYRDQQQSLENIGTRYVTHPNNHFEPGGGKWRGPFPLEAKPETAMERIHRLNSEPDAIEGELAHG